MALQMIPAKAIPLPTPVSFALFNPRKPQMRPAMPSGTCSQQQQPIVKEQMPRIMLASASPFFAGGP